MARPSTWLRASGKAVGDGENFFFLAGLGGKCRDASRDAGLLIPPAGAGRRLRADGNNPAPLPGCVRSFAKKHVAIAGNRWQLAVSCWRLAIHLSVLS